MLSSILWVATASPLFDGMRQPGDGLMGEDLPVCRVRFLLKEVKYVNFYLLIHLVDTHTSTSLLAGRI